MQMTRKLRKTAVGLSVLLAAAALSSCTGYGAPSAGAPSPSLAAQAAQTEEGCVSGVDNAPWYATVAPYEHASIQRTTVFACAAFHGSMDGPNVVQAGAPVGGYTTPFNLSTRRPDEMYLYGGGTGNATPPALQTYVAKLEPDTAKQIWRTNLSDATQNNELHLSGAVDVMANGDLVAISDHTLYKLNGDTGEILAKNDMPTGKSAPNDTAFNGIDAFPDGTIIARSLNRPPGCTKNGYPAAANPPPAGCTGAPESAPGSVLVAVNPQNLQVLNWVQLKDNIVGRVTTTVFNGHNYIYVTGANQILRYVWDGKQITQDSSWGPVTYTTAGQTQAGAPVVMNDWVVLSTNGNPAQVPLSVLAISQADGNKVARLDPNPTLQPGQISYYYAKVSADSENNRIYVMDAGVGTASAIDLRNGRLALAWKEQQLSNSYITLIGSKDKRVLVESNIKPNEGVGVTQLNGGPDGANYTEQIQWRDAATGKLLAASDYYSPAAVASQIPPGYGGYIYDMLNDGNVIPLNVRPQ
jgi:hypothetical protein